MPTPYDRLQTPFERLQSRLAVLTAENAALRQRVADLVYERDDARATLAQFRAKLDHGCTGTFCPRCDVPRPKQ